MEYDFPSTYRSRGRSDRYIGRAPRPSASYRRPALSRTMLARARSARPTIATAAAAPRAMTITGASRMNLSTRGFVGAAGDFKYIDIAQASYQCDTTGSVTHISVIPQGTTINTRLGKSCRPTSLQLRGTVYNNSTATRSRPAIYLVWDNQPNKALAGITDYLDAAESSSMIKRENASRFKTIRKWCYSLLGNTATPSTGAEERVIEEFVKLPKDCIITCTTADTTGVIGDVITGALLLITIGSKVAGTTASSFSGTMRLNFVDV